MTATSKQWNALPLSNPAPLLIGGTLFVALLFYFLCDGCDPLYD